MKVPFVAKSATFLPIIGRRLTPAVMGRIVPFYATKGTFSPLSRVVVFRQFGGGVGV